MAQTITLPFPSGGLNARDPLDAMPGTDAWEMRNILPRSGYGELPGYRLTFHDAQVSGGQVKTIISAPYRDTGEKVFTCYGGKIVYVLTATTETELETAQTEDAWQHAFINNTLVMVNGADQPQQISSVPASSDATYTTISDDSKLLDVTVFRSRLYFIEKDTTKVWYGATNATTGALTEFNLQTVIKKGGTLTWISSWTGDTGSGVQDFLMIMTSMGELIVYEGDDPATTFNIAGRYYVGRPLATRAKANIGADLWFLTREGMLSAADILSNNGAAGKYRTLTDKIQNLYRQYVYDYGAIVGWQIFAYPRSNLVMINVPPTVDQTGNGDYGIQLAMNTETGAWCKLYTLYPAWHWALWQESALFGGRGLAGTAFNPAGTATTATYQAVCNWAYTDLKARGFDKHVQMMKPVLTDFEDFGGSGETDIYINALGEPGSSSGSVVFVDDHLAAAGNFNRWVGANAYSKMISPSLDLRATDLNCYIQSMQLMYEVAGEPF